jgi:SAM-dependent methyltransferase
MFDSANLLSTDHDGYFGIFSKLRALDMFEAQTDNVYAQGLADFYDHIIGADIVDVGALQRLVGSESKRVLELACGSGRIAFPFAEAGFEVDGLELSRDMLELAERKRGELPAPVASRLRFVVGDMTQFDLGRSYDAIVLGATSISLLLDTAERQNMFRCVKRHLQPTGQFVFDTLDLRGERWRKLDNYLDVWKCETEAGLEFGIVGQCFAPGSRRYTFNVYRELIEWTGETRRAIGTSTKVRLDPEELRDELAECGLTVIAEAPHDHAIFITATHT